MKKKIFPLFLSVVLLGTIFTSCNKSDESCYSEELYQQHKDDICTMDCPGVTGCDDQAYCNECVARAHGIGLKK